MPNLVLKPETALKVLNLDLAEASPQTQQEAGEKLAALFAIFSGLLEETLNPDVICLSLYRAEDMCRAWGIPEERFEEVKKAILQFHAAARKRNPMSCLF